MAFVSAKRPADSTSVGIVDIVIVVSRQVGHTKDSISVNIICYRRNPSAIHQELGTIPRLRTELHTKSISRNFDGTSTDRSRPPPIDGFIVHMVCEPIPITYSVLTNNI